jgi:hypothetical protein
MGKGDLSNPGARSAAVERLQRVCSELDELHMELSEAAIEPNALRILRDTLSQMRKTAWTVLQGIERSQLPADKQSLFVLLSDEQMRLASYLNISISKDLEARRVRTDQDGLSAYMRVLNQVMEHLDLLFDGKA